jgi:hypothetical protein
MQENTAMLLSETEATQVLEHLKAIDAILKPRLISLTAEERRSSLKMSDKSLAFVEKCLEYSQTNPNLLPAYLNLENFRQDFKATTTFSQMLRPLAQLEEQLSDSLISSGSEVYATALTVYSSVKQAAKMNVPGAKSVYEDLGKRFQGQGRRKNDGLSE